MLKKIRVVLAVLFFLLLTLLFLDFTGTLHRWFGWLAKVQLIPAVLAVNVVVIVALAVLTLLFGRVYCSVICPLGVMQDGISNISGRRKGKKNRFGYSEPISWLRWGVLALFIAAMIAGISVIVSLLDPYAAYGRIASGLFSPLYRLGNNLLAWFAERAHSYAFYSTEVWIKSNMAIALATLIITGILAWRKGRIYCNSICPAGTLLGLISRFSIFRPAFDVEKCTKCGVCEKGCKSSCIDYRNQTIDHSRCVTCFDCLEKCKFDAMKYRPRWKAPRKEDKVDNMPSPAAETPAKKGISRRSFISAAGTFAAAGTVKAQQLQVDGGLAEIEDKKRSDRKTQIVPPGGQGVRNLKQHCTACQLCVSSCPNNILIPSSTLATFMQPVIAYERGYCRPECTECSQVCPAGAIKKITPAEKSAISIGQAIWIKDNCIVNTDGVPCHACERTCPTGAITLVAIDPDDRRSLMVPVVDKGLCIGCGGCEYICPARPFSAIYVEGNVVHHNV